MYPVGNAFNLAAQGDSRQIMVRATFNDTIVVGGDYLKSLTFQSYFKVSDKIVLGTTCAKQLNLEMYLPQSLSSVNLKTAKIFVEVGFLGVTTALNSIDVNLYVDAILGYLYENKNNDNLTFTITNDELVATAQDSGVSVRLSDGKVIAEPAEGVDVATSTFWLPMGVYYVRDFEKRNRTDNVSIVAYDGMKLIEEHVDNYSPERLNTGRTAKQLIKLIGNEIGVSTIVSDSLPNAAEHIPITGYYSKKWIDMLGYYAGFIGGNACFDRLGNLTVKPYEAVDYTVDRSQQYLSGLQSRAENDYTVDSFVCTTPESDEDYYANIPSRYNLGWINGTKGGIVTPGVAPTGDKLFYSNFFKMLYGAQYLISRETDRGLIHLYFYRGTTTYIGEDSDCASYTGTYPLNAGQKENAVTITSNTEMLRARIETTKEGGYREVYAGTSVTYEMDDAYKIKRIRGTDGVIGTQGNMPVEINNPYIYREALLTPIQQYYSGLSFYPCEVKYRGNPALDAGDIIKVTDQSGNLKNAIITSHTIKISGGMSATIESMADINI